MPQSSLRWVAIVVLALAHAAPRPQDRLAQFQIQFRRETDPVRRAKLLPHLADAEFEAIHAEMEAGEVEKALRILENYRDEVASVKKSLDATGVDAERKPAGFKELQISVRQSLRRLTDVLTETTVDQQKPFEAVRKDLEVINQGLIRELFPRQPGAAHEQEKAKP